MFKKFLAENKYKVEYYKELCVYIEKYADSERPLVAVHGMCTDGGTAGAIIRHQTPEAVIIPLDYKILNHTIAIQILENMNWFGIVDLKPFNKHQVNYWVDHHLSSMGSQVNAKRIRFDIDGDSGSYQLFLSNFLGELPQHLIELAVMTRTTDTAGYIIEPPTQIINSLSDLNITETAGENGRKQMEKRIWLLDDAWGTVNTLKDQLDLYNFLAFDGFFGLEHVLPRINLMREERIKAKEIADSISIESDVICFSFIADSIDHFTITRRLQNNGAKVVISMAIVPDGVKISLRRNRDISKAMQERIQLNELAEKMNGGGHAGASGAKTSSIEKAIEIITEWCLEKKLSMQCEEMN